MTSGLSERNRELVERWPTMTYIVARNPEWEAHMNALLDAARADAREEVEAFVRKVSNTKTTAEGGEAEYDVDAALDAIINDARAILRLIGGEDE
jgi:hypothetical protein